MDGMEVTFEEGLCDRNYGDLRFLQEMNPWKGLLMDLTLRPLKDGQHERKSRLFPLNLRCYLVVFVFSVYNSLFPLPIIACQF